MYYNYFRDYDPTLGRYVQSDPAGLMGGLNSFAYVEGNPIALFDPNGLSALGDAGAFVGGWGGRAGDVVVGEAIFPAGGGIPGAIIGGRVGAWGGRAAGEWLNNLIFSSPISGKDEFAKQTEYLRYKSGCDTPPPPTGDPCQDRRNEIARKRQCKDMRKEWDDRYWPGKHAKDIKKLSDEIADLERKLRNSWSCRECNK
ncbi:RHS repeat-associated core domain-containing protein [Mitsuaria sp. CC2]|uniref:RHS repeat-associated core domain-containing protein n=1 Tax=Mitsuaria sp. CC2 TaxID=3029186 RepID=UPI003B8D9988